uniref:Immunoglobulin V-set domain-containing protein n=1 Tax=Megaselia scalaris TaxID=36166 RepID=T1GBI6_MEGSC
MEELSKREDLVLIVKYAQQRDSGIYECQVSTTPPVGYTMMLSVTGRDGNAMLTKQNRFDGSCSPCMYVVEKTRTIVEKTMTTVSI